jgi:hypothetical protein
MKNVFVDLVQSIRRWLGKRPDSQDPYAGVRVPLRKGPHDRRAAVALQEPDE